MRVAVPREHAPGETRVAITPDAVRRLGSESVRFVVERGAGESAFLHDEAYREAGAEIAPDPRSLLQGADLILKIGPPGTRPGGLDEVELLPEGSVVIGLLRPAESGELFDRLAARGVTALALELMPRITRAQSMDALSAMSTVAGYAAVIRAAHFLPRFFPLLMTAAGTIAPARVVVLGAGVAGLQAIATARRLGAVVEAFDIRPAVKEQVESLGATFIERHGPGAGEGAAAGETAAVTASGADTTGESGEADSESGDGESGDGAGEAVETAGGYAVQLAEERQARDRELIAEHLPRADVVITTALIPGKPAPLLLTEEMVELMRPGSVIVDLAGETGGNCEMSRHGDAVPHRGVLIDCPREPAAALPVHASQMYARVLSNLLRHIAPDGVLRVDLEDVITGAICVTHEGTVRFGTKEAAGA